MSSETTEKKNVQGPGVPGTRRKPVPITMARGPYEYTPGQQHVLARRCSVRVHVNLT